MWTMKETNNVRQLVKMRLSHHGWYLGSYVVPDFEGYSILVEVSRVDKDFWNRMPSQIGRTNIRFQVRNGE